MKKIEEWLENFKMAWKTHNIEKVLGLFSDNVKYWETPFKKLSSFDDLKNEWEYINTQNDISISTNVFSAVENKFAVRWFLTYTDDKQIAKTFSGVYLIELDSSDKCCYFFHCGESKI